MKKVIKILVAISLVLSSLSRRDGRELRIFTFYFLTSKRQIALYSPCWLVGRLGGWLVSPLIFRLLYNKLEQKKTKIRIQIRDLHCLLGLQGVPKKSKCNSGHSRAILATFGRSGNFVTFLGTLGTFGHFWALWALLGPLGTLGTFGHYGPNLKNSIVNFFWDTL